MDNKEAKRRFQKADKLYTYGRFEDVLAELDHLEAHFPDNHRLLNARARTLEQLQRYEESLAICDRLLNEFSYEKIRPFRDAVARDLENSRQAPETGAGAPGPSGTTARESKSMDNSSRESRFTIKPVRLVLLLVIIAAMYFGYMPYWLGGGLIVAYFVIKLAIKAAIMKLFTAPFKMKGKALAGATCELHGFEWTEKPVLPPDSDDEGFEEDEEEDAEDDGPRRYVWIDVTITPQPRTEGFTHWEPGELMLAPLDMKVNGLDSMDDCFSVEDVKLVVDGSEQEDEMGKYVGPQRIKVLAGIPLDQNNFKFVYYFEQFGEIRLTA